MLSRYYANTETYLKSVALKRMPPNLQTVDMLKAGKILSLSSVDPWQTGAFVAHSLLIPLYSTLIPVPEPCLDSFVFLRVKETQENILVEPETDEQR